MRLTGRDLAVGWAIDISYISYAYAYVAHSSRYAVVATEGSSSLEPMDEQEPNLVGWFRC